MYALNVNCHWNYPSLLYFKINLFSYYHNNGDKAYQFSETHDILDFQRVIEYVFYT